MVDTGLGRLGALHVVDEGCSKSESPTLLPHDAWRVMPQPRSSPLNPKGGGAGMGCMGGVETSEFSSLCEKMGMLFPGRSHAMHWSGVASTVSDESASEFARPEDGELWSGRYFTASGDASWSEFCPRLIGALKLMGERQVSPNERPMGDCPIGGGGAMSIRKPGEVVGARVSVQVSALRVEWPGLPVVLLLPVRSIRASDILLASSFMSARSMSPRVSKRCGADSPSVLPGISVKSRL